MTQRSKENEDLVQFWWIYGQVKADQTHPGSTPSAEEKHGEKPAAAVQFGPNVPLFLGHDAAAERIQNRVCVCGWKQ